MKYSAMPKTGNMTTTKEIDRAPTTDKDNSIKEQNHKSDVQVIHTTTTTKQSEPKSNPARALAQTTQTPNHQRQPPTR